MKVSDIILESQAVDEEVLDEVSWTHQGINQELRAQGYRHLGSGVDQSAWLEPKTGAVLKIFGTRRGSGGLTVHQRMFFSWAKYCMSRQSNPFLPKFYGFERFEFNGDTYLQIRQERLSRRGQLAERVSHLAYMMFDEFHFLSVRDILRDYATSRVARAVNAEVGPRAFPLLVRTLHDLQKISIEKGWNWDLHSYNIMMRGRVPVIVDPWHLGDHT